MTKTSCPRRVLAAPPQAWRAQERPVAQFSSGVQLVEVYATVTDAKGELSTGLRREDFEVYENNQPQEVSAFAAGEFPLTVALGVDRSWSMAGEPLRSGETGVADVSAGAQAGWTGPWSWPSAAMPT